MEPSGLAQGRQADGAAGESEDAALMSCPRDGTGMGEAQGMVGLGPDVTWERGIGSARRRFLERQRARFSR